MTNMTAKNTTAEYRPNNLTPERERDDDPERRFEASPPPDRKTKDEPEAPEFETFS
jgi:hypothetical protein